MPDTSSTDTHLQALADLFIARFDSIAGSWREPWMPVLPFTSQNAAGHLYSGVNDISLSLVCAMKGYSTPVWLTGAQCRDLNILRLSGEKGTEVRWGGTSFYDRDKGALDTGMRWAEWEKMTPEQRERFDLREGYGHSSYVWNIEQTDFPVRHPDTWADLKAAFSIDSTAYSEKTLDSFVERDCWYPDDCHRCAILTDGDGSPVYDRTMRYIRIPSRESFHDGKEYYNTLLHSMARSVIIENAFDRAKGSSDPLADLAGINLSSELAAAVVAGRLGMRQTLSESSLQYLKEWTQVLSDDPSVIRHALRDSRVAVDIMTRCIGIEQSKAPDICATLGEQIRQAREQRESISAAKTPERVSARTNVRSGRPSLHRRRHSAHP